MFRRDIEAKLDIHLSKLPELWAFCRVSRDSLLQNLSYARAVLPAFWHLVILSYAKKVCKLYSILFECQTNNLCYNEEKRKGSMQFAST